MKSIRKRFTGVFAPGLLGCQGDKHLGLLMALIPILAGCAVHHEERGLAPYSPPIVFKFQSIQPSENNVHMALFELKNVGDSDMWFTGDGCDHPLYIKQYKRSIGWDGPTEEFGLICGMGLESCKVAAGKSIIIPIPIWPESIQFTPFRVGIRLCEDEFPKMSSPNVFYWSDAAYPK